MEVRLPQIIALAQQKGGVGKSSLAIHMAVELTSRKRKVAIFDVDAQMTVTKWKARREAEWPAVESVDCLQIKDALERHKDADYIFYDMPGKRASTVNYLMKNACLIIVPSRPLDVDIEASAETIRAILGMQLTYTFAMSIAPNKRRANEFTKLLSDKGFPIINVPIMDRLDYPDAITQGLGVTEYRPQSLAAIEMKIFTAAVLKGIKK